MTALRDLARSSVLLLLGRESRPRTIVRGLASGYRICVSPAEHLAYLLGTAEPHLQRAIKRYVAVGDTVYDIGANIGYVSLSLSKQVGPTGRVIAFEPVPRNADLLRANIQDNRIQNVSVFCVAASNRRGEATIRFAENLATASLTWHRDDPAATAITVKTVAIDEMVGAGEIGNPAFIKIDVEGAEDLVLEGMRKTLAAARPVLFVECSDAGRETTWRLLGEQGYRCQSAISGKWITAFEEYRHSDFLWIPPNQGISQ
jgi:FkbM family methyltransferase